MENLLTSEFSGGYEKMKRVFLLKNTVQDMWNELEQSLPWIKEKPIIVQEQILNMVYNLGLPNLLKFRICWLH